MEGRSGIDTTGQEQASSGGWLAGGGEMGKLLRAMDWSRTPLGPLEAWPQSLKTTVSLCLSSNFPINLIWGPQHTQIINDGYWPICGSKYREVMGSNYQECWASAWPAVGDAFHKAVSGEASYLQNQRMYLHRNGYLEETFFTFSLSPIRDENGSIVGLFHPVTETTSRMLAERRARALRELSARTGRAKTMEGVYRLAAKSLASAELDLPFMLLYQFSPDRDRAHLAAWYNAEAGVEAAPVVLELTQSQSAVWPIAAMAGSAPQFQIQDLMPLAQSLVYGPYPEPSNSAVILPLTLPGTEQATGFLIAGLSPRLPFDEIYRDFCELIATTVSSALANAHAYEEERRRAEALAELDRAKTTFFSNVSHEFRTPLTLMLGPLEELLAEDATQLTVAGIQERLTVAHRNSLRLLKLVNTLLDFSRIEAGRAGADFASCDLAAFTNDLLSSFLSAMNLAKLDYAYTCEPLGDDVQVDLDMWEKIVLNLVSNAFKYTLNGSIKAVLRKVDGQIEFTVTDTGIGIAERDMAHLFERFYRVKGSAGRSHEGTGIGLALVHELVGMHGGSISVSSELGKGSTFRVIMPMHQPRYQPLPAPKVATQRGRGSSTPADKRGMTTARAFSAEMEALASHGDSQAATGTAGSPLRGLAADASEKAAGEGSHILLVDDNADMLVYVKRILETRFEVTTAGDGEEALAAIEARKPDLVLSDVMMPRLDGFGLLARMRADEQLQAIPVILLSARAGEEAKIEGLDVGASDYLIKPFSARELLARVSAHLAMARLKERAVKREHELVTEAEAAKRSNRIKDEFLATVSHELRTPLNAIRGFSELLICEGEVPEDTLSALEAICRNAEHQAHIIDDLLDISQILAGKLRMNPVPAKITKVLEAALETVRLSADAKKITILTEVRDHAPVVLGDPNRLQQLIWNLLANAIKFTPEGGCIKAVVDRTGQDVKISISDNGLGIEPDFLPFVFDPLRQEDASLTRRYGGMGLGLSIVRHIVEGHGGSVHVESAGRGRGTTIQVTLPALLRSAPSGDAERYSRQERHEKILQGLKILAVDDDQDARMLISAFLRQAGAEAKTASSASEAYALLRVEMPDVLLSDIGMPEEDGFEFMQRIRSSTVSGKELPAIAVTAWTREEDRRQALAAGFQEHFPKPVDGRRLVKLIAFLVGRQNRS